MKVIDELEIYISESNFASIFGILSKSNNEEGVNNSLISLGKLSGKFDKQKLVPFGEYVPFTIFASFFSFFNFNRPNVVSSDNNILINSKSTGTLVCDYLLPGRNLYLFSTGTGLAPFMSIIRDPETYEKFDKIILTHTVRTTKELAYKKFLENLNKHEVYSEITKGNFVYFNTVTREKYKREGRITEWINSNKLWNEVSTEKFDPTEDRVMICGSESMTFELKEMFQKLGSTEGSTKTQGGFVIEKAFAEK